MCNRVKENNKNKPKKSESFLCRHSSKSSAAVQKQSDEHKLFFESYSFSTFKNRFNHDNPTNKNTEEVKSDIHHNEPHSCSDFIGKIINLSRIKDCMGTSSKSSLCFSGLYSFGLVKQLYPLDKLVVANFNFGKIFLIMSIYSLLEIAVQSNNLL